MLMTENQKDTELKRREKTSPMESHYPETAINILVYILTAIFLGLYG